MVPLKNPLNVLKEILSKQQPFECSVQVAELQTRFVKILGVVLKGIISPADRETLSELLNITYQHFSRKNCDYETSLICRILYTDVAMTLSCYYLLQETNNASEDHFPCLLSAIQGLDRAIVFAGAPDRLDLAHDLIETLQYQYAISKSAVHGCLLESATSDKQHCGPTLMPVPQVHIQNLLSCDLSTPFIIPGALSDWPAISDPDHAWSSVDYLLSVAGPGRIVPIEIGNDYRVDEWSQQMMPWEDFLCRLRMHDGTCKGEMVYLAQHSLLTQFPKLRDDILVPDLVYIVPETGETVHKPPANEDGLIINAWLGPKGTISPAHKDPYFNCYAQVVGSKSVWLAPPQFADEMYPLPSASGLANTTSVDVFQPDASQHPLFLQEVVPKAMVTTLRPGDLLFFPPGWWHSMRSESTSFSVSFWF